MKRSDELRALLARIHAFEISNRELDEAIHAVLLPDDPWWRAIVEGRRLVEAGDPEAYVICPPTGPLGGENRMRAATWAEDARVGAYSTSIDAAVGLIGRVLPGWRRYIEEIRPEARWWGGLKAPEETSSGVSGARSAYHDGPALALIAALLSALIAREEAEHGR